jgi:hypothetical protein
MLHIQLNTSKCYVLAFNIERVISCTGVHSYVTVHVKLSVYKSLNLIGQWITASLTLRSALVGHKWPALRPAHFHLRESARFPLKEKLGSASNLDTLNKKRSFYHQSKH